MASPGLQPRRYDRNGRKGRGPRQADSHTHGLSSLSATLTTELYSLSVLLGVLGVVGGCFRLPGSGGGWVVVAVEGWWWCPVGVLRVRVMRLMLIPVVSLGSGLRPGRP